MNCRRDELAAAARAAVKSLICHGESELADRLLAALANDEGPVYCALHQGVGQPRDGVCMDAWQAGFQAGRRAGEEQALARVREVLGVEG